MREYLLAIALFLPLAMPASAQNMAEAAMTDAAADEYQPVEPDSNWLISQAECRIDGSWGEDIAITLVRHEDHHDLTLFDPALKSVKADQAIPVRFGAGGKVVEGDYQAVGYRDGKSRFYVANVDDTLIDAIAAGGTFQFYRDALEVDLDMKAFPPALAAMRTCEAQYTDAAMSAADAAAAAAAGDGAADAQ